MSKPTKVVIIAADYHQDIANQMIKAATQTIQANQAEIIDTIRVPGSYEIPLVAQTVITTQQPDALVVLGYIERGYTMHGEVMGHVVHSALIDLQLKYNLPIGLGIIGPGATRSQAKKRQTKSAQGAANAALRIHRTIRDIITKWGSLYYSPYPY